jgi:hypothetical protein
MQGSIVWLTPDSVPSPARPRAAGFLRTDDCASVNDIFRFLG